MINSCFYGAKNYFTIYSKSKFTIPIFKISKGIFTIRFCKDITLLTILTIRLWILSNFCYYISVKWIRRAIIQFPSIHLLFIINIIIIIIIIIIITIILVVQPNSIMVFNFKQNFYQLKSFKLLKKQSV